MKKPDRGSLWGAWSGLALAAVMLGCRPQPQPETTPQPEAADVPSAVQAGSPAAAIMVPPVDAQQAVEVGTVLGHFDPNEGVKNRVSLTYEKDKGIYHVSLQDPHAEIRETEGGKVIYMRGGGARRKPGSPDISGLVWVLQGKRGMNLMPTITDAAFAVATQGVDIAAVAVPVTPVEGEEDAAPVFERVRSDEIYGEDAFFPSHVVRVQETWVGTNKLVRLIVNPVQYNPVTGTLRLCYRLSADLEYVKALVPEEEGM